LLLLIALGSALIYILNPDSLSHQVIIATGASETRREVTLPDGSSVILNHNTRLAYNASFEGSSRNVTLSGEAFFDITPDASKPFIIDAGKASVKVVGTSFNVITENIQKSVEVFVLSGKVILSDNSGSHNLTLEPGYVGKMNSSYSARELNSDPNYMSWNTGILVYDGQTLEKVFSDLKRVFNMNITAEDPSILKNTWTSPIDIESKDTIIRLICTSFNLDYMKDGDSYHLKKK
jgi:ferric-dicitrate binding protein FerR (iron transport regulator)